MAVKRSEIYSRLRQSCDELRGGMDASQYKDYVLFMLFMRIWEAFRAHLNRLPVREEPWSH